jgi:DNA-binding response OmpR family regulator
MTLQVKPDRGQTLLIVEDDILSAMALQDELEDAGYRVLDFNGRSQDALAEARAHKPALALVNIELQGRDDGIVLADELRAMGVPTLFINGQVSRAMSMRTVAIGSLPKPYRASDVVIAVDHLLARLQGDTSRPRPEGLEVFDRAADAATSDLL